jgi:hypothetical protein
VAHPIINGSYQQRYPTVNDNREWALACRGGRSRAIRELQEQVQGLGAPGPLGVTAKRCKRELWKKYDELIRRGDPSDPMVLADRALSFCYAHRRRWNGVRRCLSAGLVLRQLSNEILARTDSDRADLIRQICLGAPTRFALVGQRIALKRTDPGLGCNAVWTHELTPTQPQPMLF